MIGGERDSRPKHITAWTWNVAEEFCMHLRLSACVRLRAPACRKLNIRMGLDAKGSLRPDMSFVQGLSGRTICMMYYMYKLCSTGMQLVR